MVPESLFVSGSRALPLAVARGTHAPRPSRAVFDAGREARSLAQPKLASAAVGSTVGASTVGADRTLIVLSRAVVCWFGHSISRLLLRALT